MDNIETITTEMSYSIGSEADIDLERKNLKILTLK